MRFYHCIAGLFLLLQAYIAEAGDTWNDGETSVTVVLNSTLSGEPSNHYPVTVVLSNASNTTQVNFFAPYLGSDVVQRIHVFIANEDKRVLELEFDKELGEANAKTNLVLRQYWAPHNVLKSNNNFLIKSQVVNGTWSGSAGLPIAYLPPAPSLVNVAVAHQLKDDVHYDSLYSITNSGIAIPDMMVLQRYRKIDPKILSSYTTYSSEWKTD